MHAGLLKVRKEPAARAVVSVTDIVASHNGFTSDLTAFSHDKPRYFSKRSNRRA
ncbi:Fructose-6-phosphate phosphoketolase [Candidatus Puniceispirillum marinum IMCC1322]|uniref:Fructose-6-phosphate phosphoketolase n=1 Tax=Puniceispirillum marinum (strain IMCC1322) TaxID=488538 RepID=D5BMV4_PUNMI|nr:Fructose-6-phosphate phosphoketolase [Candidatus Puniceispirillum marinum IMCC1322]